MASHSVEAVKPSYHAEARRFLKVAGDRGLSLETMREFVDSLAGEGKSASTINKHIPAMRSVVRAAFEFPEMTDVQRWKLKLAMEEVGYRKRSKGQARVTTNQLVSEEEYLKLLEHATERNALVLEFLWHTGCRISEALGARLTDCTAQVDHVKVPVLGKGQKERHVRISESLSLGPKGSPRQGRQVWSQFSHILSTMLISSYPVMSTVASNPRDGTETSLHFRT